MKSYYSRTSSTVKANKALYMNIRKALDSIVNGRFHSTLPFISYVKGVYSEPKVRMFTDKLIQAMRRYAEWNDLWSDGLSGECSKNEIQKNIYDEKMYFERYVRLYLDIVIRLTLLEISRPGSVRHRPPKGTFQDIVSGCFDLKSEEDKDALLADYYNYNQGYDMERNDVAGWCIELTVAMPRQSNNIWLSENIMDRMERVGRGQPASVVKTSATDRDKSGGERDGDIEGIDEFDDMVTLGDVDDIEDIKDMEALEASLDRSSDEYEEDLKYYEQCKEVCAKFAEFMELIYSGDISFQYLSQMTRAVEGMVDTFLCENQMSAYLYDDDMNKILNYIDKTIEKCLLVNRDRDNKVKKERMV